MTAPGLFGTDDALASLREAARADGAGRPLPAAVLTWLAELRLLARVPFPYLVVDGALLPAPESIRFFFLDRNWTDAACDGALSVAAGARERAQLRVRHAELRDAVDRAERAVRHERVDPTTTLSGAPDTPITGFLLRSRLVSGWPGLRVSASRAGVARRLLRLERLAPSLLLALFDDVPDVVTLQEPPHGPAFGVDPTPDGGYGVPARDGAPAADVRFRAGAPGVVDVAALAGALGATGHGAALGRRLLQFPFRLDFREDPNGDPERVFSPSITLADLDAAMGAPS